MQTISGTGAVHLAFLLIAENLSPRPRVYVGVPAWGNYSPMCKLAGLDVVEYRHFDASARSVDMPSILKAVQGAPKGSVFVIQACCHNPTGADLSNEQWHELAIALKDRDHLPLLDIAYQGLGNGLDEDAYGVRLLARMGMPMLICQSFSKNFALYGERCGALHALCGDSKTTANVFDRLRCLIRWEFSSAPAYGCRLVDLVTRSNQLSQNW